MSLLKQIDDKGAVLEWSPIAAYPNLVALGTKDSSGIGFDDHGGELELHALDFGDTKSFQTKILGKARANSRFSSIAWSQMVINSEEFPYGLIAGGMVDGNIHVWDPSKLAEGDPDALLASVEQHQGAIYGLHFNPHKESSHLLASGGSDGEVFVTSLEHPYQPSVFIPAPPPNNAKHTADITKVAWNTQVAHILASAAQNGSCFIWDLRQKRAWCELRDPSGGCVSDVAWNPDQGLHLVTASGDDKNPVLKLWDLRSSTSLPLATLQGHTEGILSISWCPSDPSLLMSCGKDNRTILWDLFHLQAVYDLPSRDPSQSVSPDYPGETADQNEVFGNLASNAGQRRYHVSWSPCMPAVMSACSFDRRVQFFSLSGARSKIGRAPKWLRKPVGAAFGFGGKLVTFDNQNVPVANQSKKTAAGSVKIKISQVVEDSDLVTTSEAFHQAIADSNYKGFCKMKTQSSQINENEKQVWSMMDAICFGVHAREELLTHLGFNSESISKAASEYSVNQNSSSLVGQNYDNDFTTPVGLDANSYSMAETMGINVLDLIKKSIAGIQAEPTIRKAIIIGNFEAAVNCCINANLMAEALLLAQCGDQALKVKTQATFFERQRLTHPFLNVLHAVIKNELMIYVLNSDLNNWRETLALLSTYSKTNEFASFCEALAARLEIEVNDKYSATLCYMGANNVPRTISFWVEELDAANELAGHLDTIALENFIEKVVVFTRANPTDDLGPKCSSYFAKYAELLANQGKLDLALNYLKGDSVEESILIDRLYHSGTVKPVGSRPPPFPFMKMVIEPYDPSKYLQGTTSVHPGNRSKADSFDVTGDRKILRSVSADPPNVSVKTTKQVINRSNSDDDNNFKSQQQNRMNFNPALSNAMNQSREWDSVAATTNTMSVPVQSTATYVLPPGWIQLVDPASNHPYYVNKATGVSQWEAPPSASLPSNTPSVVAATNPITTGNVNVSPELKVKPVSVEVQKSPAIVQQSLAKESSSDNSTAQNSETIALIGKLIEGVAASCVSAGDKKQIAMVRSAYHHLCEIGKTSVMTPNVMQKLIALAEGLAERDFVTANQIQTDLANTAWDKHKEWLKGTKVLIQLASKK